MPTEDKFLAMKIRRILAKKECDMTLMQIGARAGVVYLTGEIRTPRGYTGNMDLHDELDSIEKVINRIPDVRDVVNDVRIIEM